MKMEMSKKDRLLISKFLKYLACVLSVVFLVYGAVKLLSSKKDSDAAPPAVQNQDAAEEKKPVDKSDGKSSWVDEVLSSDDESKPSVPSVEMGAASDVKISPERKAFIDCARKYIGTPYKYGGADRDGMDCSGFVYAVAMESGLGKLPKSSGAMKEYAEPVDKSEMLPGDLVFFIRDGKIFHVAIYLGGNRIIHSMSDEPVTGVAESSLDEAYWASHYDSSGRIFK
ncbi:MAG: C40 family peptidase [Treponema sp.]|nr:C40 family peptidase [Treponema sp.]